MKSMSDPDQFYSERVPTQWNRTLKDQAELAALDESAQAMLQEMQRVDATMKVLVEDPATDRTYLLNIANGEMSCDPEARREPFLVLVHDLETFETLERESGDSILGFLGALAGQPEDMKLTVNRLRNLSELNGRARLELAEGSPMSLEARLGEGIQDPSSPACMLRLPSAVYAALKGGELAPQDAFLSGQITIEGDMNLAMQLALAAVSPD